jgi:hypothetical protein
VSNIKLFQINGPEVWELAGQSVAVEKFLQTLTEKHLDAFFGVSFLATEYSTGKTQGAAGQVQDFH